jgi:N-acetylneuraminic acid mutarotase
MLTRIVFQIGVLALAGCGGGGGDGTPATGSGPTPPTHSAPPSVLVDGAVQKGPFIVGSTVLINRLDSRGRSTPSTLLTEVEDSIGSFSFETDESGPVQIVATGYYFSELTGQISGGVLTLRALYDVSANARQIAHVNILTHLINDRVLELISDGQPSLREAIAQAEDEMIAALSDALVIPDLNQFSALSVYDSASSQNNPLGNAYLLALSTAFYKYAKTKSEQFGTTTDAELTLVLNRLSDDLADDGRLEPGPFIGEFVSAIRSLSPETIAANLRSRSLVDYPQGLGVPDISVFLQLCAGTGDCPWSAGAPMPSALAGHATAVHGGKVYVFGGTILPGPCCGDAVVEYDPVANEWTSRRPMPAMTRDAAAHTIGDRIYLVMGTNGLIQLENKLYEYDPAADRWSVKTDRPTYRRHFATSVVNGRLYVIGGIGEIDNGPGFVAAEIKSHVEIYDAATDRWSTGASAPTALTNARACVVGNQIHVFGGSSVVGMERSILVYDTTSNSWSAKAPMPNTRYAFDCATVDGAVYLIGGFGVSPPGLFGTVERYDPFVQTWSSPTRLPTPRYPAPSAVVGNRVFTIGGTARSESNGVINDRSVDVVEILDTERL